jgi:hypothetical protein
MPRPPEDVRRRLDELLARSELFLPRRPDNDSAIPRELVKFSATMSELLRFLISPLTVATLRLSSAQPDVVSQGLLEVLPQLEQVLIEGSAITIEDNAVRFRKLPIR